MSYIINIHCYLIKHKTLIADAAYDSKKLRDKMDELKLGKLLTHKNRRNGKYKEIKDIQWTNIYY